METSSKFGNAERWPSNFRTLVDLFQRECSEAHNALDLLSNKLLDKNFSKIIKSNKLIQEMRNINDGVFILMEFNNSVECFLAEKDKLKNKDCSESDNDSLYSCLNDRDSNSEKISSEFPDKKSDILEYLDSTITKRTENLSGNFSELSIGDKKSSVNSTLREESNLEDLPDTIVKSEPLETSLTEFNKEEQLFNKEEQLFNKEMQVQFNIPPQHITRSLKELDCKVTHIESPSRFYITLINDEDNELMLTKINSYYFQGFQYVKKMELIKYTYYACLHEAKYKRAKLVNILSDDQEHIEVFLIDLGKQIKARFHDLTPLAEEFGVLPPMAFLCHLYNVEPLATNNGKWTKYAVKYMNNKTLELTGNMYIAEIVNMSYGILLTINGNLINTLLISNDFACEKTSICRPAIENVQLYIPPPPALLKKKSLECIVSHIETPSTFYVTMDKDGESLKKRLATFYNRNEQTYANSHECTQLYYACLHNNDWSRVMVVDKSNEAKDELNVFFLDKGMKSCVLVSSLRPLDVQFLDPPCAYLCHLYLICPADEKTNIWSNKAIKFMKRKTLLKKCEICVDEINGGSNGVILRVDSVTINLQLVIKDHARQSSNQSLCLEKYVPAVKEEPIDSTQELESGEETQNILLYPSGGDANNVSGSHISNMTVTPRASVTRDSVQPSDDVDYDLLNQPMGAEEENVNLCIAAQGFYANDEAEVCEHYKGPPATACFKGSNCKKKHVLLNKNGWTIKKIPVIVNTTQQMVLPVPDSCVRVGMTIVKSYCSFFGHILPNGESTESADPLRVPKELKELSQKMNCAAALKSLKTFDTQDELPGIGELVAAFYPEDGLWYRGRVIEVGDNEIDVLYIDFGNQATIQHSQVGRLDLVFAQIPQQAVRFVVDNISLPLNSPKAEDAMKALFSLVVDLQLHAVVMSVEIDDVYVILFDQNGDDVGSLMANMNLVDHKESKVINNRIVTEEARRLNSLVRQTDMSQEAILYGTQFMGLYPG